jgi:hypothetical protein
MSEYLNVNVTLHMEVENEAAAIVLRNKILGLIEDYKFNREGLYEMTCSEPYSAYDEGSEAPPECPARDRE